MNADVSAVVEFLTQVRMKCRALVTNPFDVNAGESMVDLLLESAPLAEEALLRIAREGTAIELLLDAVENTCA